MKKGDCLQAAREALNGKKAVVVGLASTGIAASRFLAKCGAKVTATDSRAAEVLPGVESLASYGVEIKAGGHSGIELDGVDMIVVSPGVPSDLPFLNAARKAGSEVISDIELAWRFIDSPVIAIAGTNGKTTTTTLLGQALEDSGLKVFVGGNIGTPAVEYVENGGGADLCVLEISSFHLETTKFFKPHIAILINITEDHLDRYRDFEHYAATKFRLFENQSEADFAVVNANDPVIAARQASLGRGKVIPFTVEGKCDGLYLDGGSIVHMMDGRREEYPVDGIRLTGLHNMENVMAVIAAARLAGVSKSSLMKTLGAFSGLHHRMETVREFGGVTYIDDSKGTNIGALQMALRGLKGPIVLIAGGVDKGGDYRVLGPLVREKVKAMVLLGEAKHKINDALGHLTKTVIVESFEDGVKAAHESAVAGDTVLLCPACSSFDMFRNYKERGERFRALVEAL
ncbi:MAG: UDP-N-acetylmuramoyl-L-alanine--D-glutamate ligase [Deltaproteobacteria bacterium]|nr:UDP-N-acetylmuramoyl-L-alanine--D-glutamate ligase [Deltaproteobacteria bacterium]